MKSLTDTLSLVHFYVVAAYLQSADRGRYLIKSILLIQSQHVYYKLNQFLIHMHKDQKISDERFRDSLNQSLISKENQEIDKVNQPEPKQSNSKTQKIKQKYETSGNILMSGSAFSKVFFLWIGSFVSFGNHFQLTKENIPQLPEGQTSKVEFDRFYNIFKAQPKSKRKGSKLTKTIFKSYKKEFIVLSVQLLIYTVASMLTPVLSDKIINYIEEGAQTRETSDGVVLFLGVFLLTILNVIFQSHIYYKFGLIGFNVANTLSLMIFDKSLKHPILCLKKYTVSEIINYSQVDAQRMTYMGYQLSALLFTPIQVFIGIFLMYKFIGVSFLSGTGVMVITICLTFFLSKFSKRANNDLLKAKDKRMKVTEEIFNIIRFIKINAYQKYFFRKLNQKRQTQLHYNKKRLTLSISTIFLYWLATPLILSVTFLTFVALGNSITATQAFTTIMLFRILQTPIRMLPTAIAELIQMMSSVQRIQKYLQAQQMDYANIKVGEASNQSKFAIEIKNGSYQWGKQEENKESDKNQKEKEKEKKQKKQKEKLERKEQRRRDKRQKGTMKVVLKQPEQQVIDSSFISESESALEKEGSKDAKSIVVQQINGEKVEFVNTLRNINLQIPKGSFTMIIGDIGSGKSSLLYSILNQMKPSKQSEIRVNGSIAYVPQKPWIMTSSLKDNITFTHSFQKQKFDQVIKYSSMETDIKLLIDGQDTQIGQKGVNLSGGQKARIALARALYSQRDIYLLDDIISAVDVHVGEFIMRETILNYLKGRTVVMPTHAVKFVEFADQIIIMKDGQIIKSGPYAEVKKSPEFQDIYTEESQQSQEVNQEQEEQKIIEQLKKLKSLKAVNSSKKVSKQVEQAPTSTTQKVVQQLIMPEDQRKGTIGQDIYKEYFYLNGGYGFIFSVLLCMTFWLAFNTLSNIWMEKWCQHPEEGDFYLYLFLGFSLSSSLFMLIRAYILVLGGIKCGSVVHKKIIKALLYASLNKFYNRVPIGRIINRLAKDMRQLDEAIGFSVGGFFVSFFRLVGTLFICIYAASPWIVLPMILVAYACNRLRLYYMKTQRECIRLENVTTSPIVSGFLSAVNGIGTIRAYNLEEQFLANQLKRVDQNRRLRIARQALEGWFCQRLSLITFVINMSAIAFCMLSSNENASLAGLLLTYALNLSGDIINTIFSFTYLETKMVSVERLCSFIKIEPEDGYLQYTKKWRTKQEGYENVIQKGQISFIDTKVRYKDDLPFVLKGVTFHIKGAQKIGIVGRTGAGKSTIINCLLRILDSAEGQILIDGQSIDKFFLKDLRYNITMIDQEPTLINASFRQNLDPRNTYSDAELNEIIKECNLLGVVESKGGLDSQITNDSLSVGEKQLLCICRAFLKHSKIVLVDEATANIDQKNDQLIQEVISTKFKESTVLTIAHRLSTLKNSDKILVLGEGQVLEWGTPQELLKMEDGIYKQMCQKGKVSNDFLS